MQNHVVIIGGGFSGTLLAINLVRYGGPRATLIERRERIGVGLAYGDADPSHLLNVRASNMSAFPDQPDHFVQWLKERGHSADGATFVSRRTYGAYLRELVEDTFRSHPGQLQLINGAASDVRVTEQGARVILDDGQEILADRIVLAVGNLPPHDPAGLSAQAAKSERYVGDPWCSNRSPLLTSDGHVLILGTGLTMVDMVSRLQAGGFSGKITALSRRGLLPNAHGPQEPFLPIREKPTGSLSKLVNDVRARSAEIGWRNAVDELRPFTQSLWLAADSETRERFLRHLRPWWDVHRHRIAPAIWHDLQRLLSTKHLQILAARTLDFAESDDGIAVKFKRRAGSRVETMTVKAVINCIGPQGDLTRTSDPLLRRLVRRGAIRPDAARLGIDVDTQNRVILERGVSCDQLLAVGPMTRGAFWEIVAVPDIRRQTWALARRLANAHWVGGEGL